VGLASVAHITDLVAGVAARQRVKAVVHRGG
jgi:hypothetical protein